MNRKSRESSSGINQGYPADKKRERDPFGKIVPAYSGISAI